MTLGRLGEELVACWLEGQGSQILHRRWHCRWGEIDLIALGSDRGQSLLTFVEVKTRSSGNWDADGLLALTPKKQQKLLRAAQLFLSEFPEYGDRACGFALALVKSQKLAAGGSELDFPKAIAIGVPVTVGGYRLVLHAYLPFVLE